VTGRWSYGSTVTCTTDVTGTCRVILPDIPKRTPAVNVYGNECCPCRAVYDRWGQSRPRRQQQRDDHLGNKALTVALARRLPLPLDAAGAATSHAGTQQSGTAVAPFGPMTHQTPVAAERASKTPAPLTITRVNPLEHADEIKQLFLTHERPEFPAFSIVRTPRLLPRAPKVGWVGTSRAGSARTWRSFRASFPSRTRACAGSLLGQPDGRDGLSDVLPWSRNCCGGR